MPGSVASSTPFDPAWFRQVLGQYPTGVSVVAAIGPSGPVGLAVGTVTSVSLDPPLVGFLPGKTSTSWPAIEAAGRFCINVLSDAQEHLSRSFATKDPDKFRGIRWRPSPSGTPILDGVTAWIDCCIESVYEAGDHYIVIGRVDSLDVERTLLPLLFFQGGYGRFAPRSLASGDSHFRRELKLVDLARPGIEQLATEFGARCVAMALVAEQVVIMASAGAAVSVRDNFIGERIPLIPPMGSAFMAYAPSAQVEGWLAKAAPPDRVGWPTRLRQVRARGYSVALTSPAHAQFEALLGRAAPAAGEPVGDLVEHAITELPYDPVGFDLEHAPEVRSLHAPVFDVAGHVGLVLTLFLGAAARHDRCLVRRAVDRLLEVADRVTLAAGGHHPPARD
jgi:flavin reductase (DIM6/NTAB) family NADH-FMN oxidoreductase RutF